MNDETTNTSQVCPTCGRVMPLLFLHEVVELYNGQKIHICLRCDVDGFSFDTLGNLSQNGYPIVGEVVYKRLEAMGITVWGSTPPIPFDDVD